MRPNKHRTIGSLKQLLDKNHLAAADRKRGKELFGRTCATCHVLFGEGKKIGPELTGSNRKNVDYLIQNIADPSAVVGAEFRNSVYTLNDGRVLSGIVREKNDHTITIECPQGQQTIDRKEIQEVQASDRSLMPDDLLKGLSESQKCDLIAFLMSDQ